MASGLSRSPATMRISSENLLSSRVVPPTGPEAAALVPCDTIGLNIDFIKSEGVGDPWGYSGECC